MRWCYCELRLKSSSFVGNFGRVEDVLCDSWGGWHVRRDFREESGEIFIGGKRGNQGGQRQSKDVVGERFVLGSEG